MKTTSARKLGGLLLTASVLVGMMVTAASAQGGAKLEFVYPDDVPRGEVTLTVHPGYPEKSGLDGVEALETLTPAADGSYTIEQAGTYSYWVRGDGYYNVCRVFNVTQADLTAGTKELKVETGKMAYEGYEPSSPKLANVPENYSQPSDAVIMVWPDEITEHFTTDTLRNFEAYDTPFFTKERADHEFTSQEEMMEYVLAKEAACEEMYVYNLGNTPVYGFQMPIAVFTTTDLSSAKTLEEAGRLVRANGKLNIWIQSQIHPNEPAAGEGALVLINDLTGAYGEEVLKEANVMVVPRINPDGSYLFTRSTYQGFDMNRDHMALKAPELAFLHTGYRYFMPEVAADGHEFGFYGVADGYMRNADDLEVTPASSLNNDPAVNALAEAIVDGLHKDAVDAGLRVYHYGYTVNNPIGRAYYGLYNSISVLVETRGIGGGTGNFARRVYSQQLSMHNIIDGAVARADEIQAAVAAARKEVVEKGASYDEADQVVLYQVASGKTQSPTPLTRYQYSVDGIQAVKTSAATLSMNDTIVRSRTRPTAYVIPKGTANLDKILYIMDNQGAEYYELAAGSSATLEQYYYVGAYTYNDKNVGFTADLRDAEKVVFERGAYVIPMDQVAGNIIAMTMEPDVNDSNGYDGTLVQYGLVSHDESTKNYPIYRYTGENPRITLVSNAADPAPTQDPTSAPDPEPEPQPEPQPTPAGTYTVQSGDTLWKIAKAQLGSGGKWELIYQANKDIIRDPNMIYIGQVLKIPAQ